MATVNVRKETGRLYIDFRFSGIRCREQTPLQDTANNRRKLVQFINRMDAEIVLGQFDYSKTFPNSKNSVRFTQGKYKPSQTFAEFAEIWLREKSVEWRNSYRATVRYIVTSKLVAQFGEKKLSSISKADVLSYRASLFEQGSHEDKALSARYINRLVGLLKSIVSEGQERHGLTHNFDKIAALKTRRPSINPFSIDEISSLVKNTPRAFKNYVTVRVLTGMRTGEVNGLRWSDIDFENNVIKVRSALINGKIENTKSVNSDRDILMNTAVHDALKKEYINSKGSEFVFTRKGRPIAQSYFTTQIWYPLLNRLNIQKRRPYQLRHTAATLWLSAGENPLWIARQLGHQNPRLLFETYTQFVENNQQVNGRKTETLIKSIEVKPCS